MGKQPTSPDAPERGVVARRRGGSQRRAHRRDLALPARHDGRPERVARAARRARRSGRHARLPRRARGPARRSRRPLRPLLAAARAACRRATCARPSSSGSSPTARFTPRSTSPARGGAWRSSRPRASTRSRSRCSTPTPTARTSWRLPTSSGGSDSRRDLALPPGLRRVPRVRAHLHDRDRRLRPAPHGPLPRVGELEVEAAELPEHEGQERRDRIGSLPPRAPG